MVRLRKGRIILVGILILIILFALIIGVNGIIQDQNGKIATYAKLIQEQRVKIEQLEDYNRNLEKINYQQNQELNQMKSESASGNVNSNADVAKVETVNQDETEIEVETETKTGFNKDTFLVGAATVGAIVGSALKIVRLLPVIP